MHKCERHKLEYPSCVFKVAYKWPLARARQADKPEYRSLTAKGHKSTVRGPFGTVKGFFLTVRGPRGTIRLAACGSRHGGTLGGVSPFWWQVGCHTAVPPFCGVNCLLWRVLDILSFILDAILRLQSKVTPIALNCCAFKAVSVRYARVSTFAALTTIT
jgi:hypothetical protein